MEHDKIAVVTDSACDLPKEYIEKCEELYVLPLRVSFGSQTYKSEVDIDAKEVCVRMDAGEIPVTSLPEPGDLENIFEALRARSIRKVLFVMMSSGLSGTLNMVRMICQQKKDFATQIYDSKILSMGLGYMVMNAVDLIRQGVQFDRLNETLTAMRENVDGFFYLPSLEHLRKGGRLGLVASKVGKMLNIHPIIACNAEGKYYARATCIGDKRTSMVVRRMVSDFVEGKKYELSIVHANAPEAAKALMNDVKSLPGLISAQILPLSASLAAHVGTGMLAVCTRRS